MCGSTLKQFAIREVKHHHASQEEWNHGVFDLWVICHELEQSIQVKGAVHQMPSAT